MLNIYKIFFCLNMSICCFDIDIQHTKSQPDVSYKKCVALKKAVLMN